MKSLVAGGCVHGFANQASAKPFLIEEVKDARGDVAPSQTCFERVLDPSRLQ
jgi:hypothetical protein